MKKVFVVCEERERSVIERQLYSNPINDCYFVFDKSENYDYVVVLDSVSKPTEVKVGKKRRLFFTGETPYVRRYNKAFLSQFGGVYGCDVHKLYADEHQMMNVYPWFIGREYDKQENSWKPTRTFQDVENFQSNKRPKKICLLSSNKTITRGHQDRVNFIKNLIKYASDLHVDVYGNGYLPFEDKFDVLKDYEYSIIIENSRYPNYFTEKILDCYLMGCYPIYYGCNEIIDYYPKNSITQIDIKRFDTAVNTIRKVLNERLFERFQDDLQKAKKLTLYDYNLFTVISKVICVIGDETVIPNSSPDVLMPQKKTRWDLIREKIARKTNIILK